MAQESTKFWGKFLSIVIVLAMVFSTTAIMSNNASAETISDDEFSIPETPPIPPFTIYGLIFDEIGEPASDATVTITNLRTDETLYAEVYENGAYEGILEDLPSEYEVNDEIEIAVTTQSKSITKVIVVEHMGFGERVDIYFGNNGNTGKSNAGTPALTNAQSTAIDTAPLTADALQPLPDVTPVAPVIDNPTTNTIIIDALPTTTIADPVLNVVLADIRAPPYFRLAFTGLDNDLRVTIANQEPVNYKVRVDLYEIKPDGITETFIDTLHFGKIKAGTERTKVTNWVPMERGRNWIRGEISVQTAPMVFEVVNEFKESFNVVPGWRPVLELGPTTISEPTVWENLTVVINGDLIVNAPLSYVNTDVVGDDLIVSAAPVTIDAASTHDMGASSDGQYKVEVTAPDGILNIYGLLWNNPDNKHYNFYMNGTLNVNGLFGGYEGTIENTFGSPDLSQPGGI